MSIARPSIEKCYALGWSYGMICVGAGACKRGAYKERLRYELYELNQCRTFDLWAEEPEIRALQEKNNRANRKFHRARIKKLIAKIRAKAERESFKDE